MFVCLKANTRSPPVRELPLLVLSKCGPLKLKPVEHGICEKKTKFHNDLRNLALNGVSV